MPPSDFNILGQSLVETNWNGSPLTLAFRDSATMSPTSNGSMILAYQNTSQFNNDGRLSLTSGGSQPQFLRAPALLMQPMVVINNWQGSNLTLTNISAVAGTPIWIAAYGPGYGATPATLPITGEPVAVAVYGTLKAITVPQWMQLGFQANSSGLCLFAFIGGPQDKSGNNAYAIALNSPCGDTGPGTVTPAPDGYYATAGGNSYSFNFNWGTAIVYVAYFGSGSVASKSSKMMIAPPTVTLEPM
jgi:hypothetical protein